MNEMGPGPLGLCPVRGVFEVEKDIRIWLANTGMQPIRIEQNKVVAMAECVTAGPGASPGDGQNDGDEVNGLVERAAPHLTGGECQQLRAAMAARRHLFATGKGDHGRTDIKYTRATKQRLNNELDDTRPRSVSYYRRRFRSWATYYQPRGLAPIRPRVNRYGIGRSPETYMRYGRLSDYARTTEDIFKVSRS